MPRKYIKKHKKSYTTEDLAAAKDKWKLEMFQGIRLLKSITYPFQHYMTI